MLEPYALGGRRHVPSSFRCKHFFVATMERVSLTHRSRNFPSGFPFSRGTVTLHVAYTLDLIIHVSCSIHLFRTLRSSIVLSMECRSSNRAMPYTQLTTPGGGHTSSF
jgi:hypothetical protein